MSFLKPLLQIDVTFFYFYLVLHSCVTKLTRVDSMEVLMDGTVALVGGALVQYNVSSGQLLFSKQIHGKSGNLTLVKLCGQQCVAIKR